MNATEIVNAYQTKVSFKMSAMSGLEFKAMLAQLRTLIEQTNSD